MDEREQGRPTAIVAPNAAGIAAAARALRAGGLAAFPTETVYGLGADATNGEAIASLYAAKGRPRFNPLIAHVEGLKTARRIGRFDATSLMLAKKFWPGPLTLVVPVAEPCPVADLARAGLSTIAIRIPAHRVARALIAAIGRPIVAPSANRSGHVSATAAAHVMADLDGRIDVLIDGGSTAVGLESTILACLGEGVRLLRAGGLPREAVEAALGMSLQDGEVDDAAAPMSPGRLQSHYAPHSPMRLDATEVRRGEALLAFGPGMVRGEADAAAVENLSPTGDLTEAAARLFAALRSLDAAGPTAIAVSPIPKAGLGEAIVDRLARAASPRD